MLIVAPMGCCKNPTWSLQNSSGPRQLCERTGQRMAHCSCPLSIPNHSSLWLYPTSLSRHRAVPSSLFASSRHWGNSKVSTVFNKSKAAFLFKKQSSPEVGLGNGTQHVPHLPVSEASKEQCWLSVDQSSYTSRQTSQVLILGEGFASFLTSGVCDPRQK